MSEQQKADADRFTPLRRQLLSLGLGEFAAAAVFGLIEYLNYFHVRLSYPWSTWASQVGRWSTPRLVRDLRRA